MQIDDETRAVLKRERAGSYSRAKRWGDRGVPRSAIQRIGPSANVGGSGDWPHVVADRSERLECVELPTRLGHNRGTITFRLDSKSASR